MREWRRWCRRWVLAVLLALGGAICVPTARAAGSLEQINHIIVIYQENWSFDGLYGKFPGANGLENAGAAVQQVDKNGKEYASLPRPDAGVPNNLPVQPFDLAPYIPPSKTTRDLIHAFYQEQYQIDGGKMDKFIAWSDAGGLVMSYYDGTTLPEGKLALDYTLCDNFFHAAFGGSFLNHQWLVSASTPAWPDAPTSVRARLNADGIMTADGKVTPDGYVVNTAYTVTTPHPAGMSAKNLVPLQTQPTIGDRLSEQGIAWAWYAGGWKNAIAGHPSSQFNYHHQPFAYYANYAEGTPGRAEHLKDEEEFLEALKTNGLPAVSFVKPLGSLNEHPGYSLLAGQQHVVDLVSAVQSSPYWADSAIIVAYDENGGRWDHVAPPVEDRWGPGTRVPAIIISPFAKKGFVDHTQYDTTSILKLIETRWGLSPLTARDAAANNMLNSFDF